MPILKPMISPFFWSEYSKKLKGYIQKPRSFGSFTHDQAVSVRLVSGQGGTMNTGNCLRMDLLIDQEDGVVIDAKYQVYGESILIGLCEACVHLIIGKNYDQAARMHLEVIDHFLRDKDEVPAFPQTGNEHVLLVLQAIQDCARECMDIPIKKSYEAPPIETLPIEGNGFEGFKALTLSDKIQLINQVLDHEVRPYIEMDAGGVEVIGLQDNQITIEYQGTCTSCYSATGATLSFIQKVIQAKIDPDLTVIPNL